MVKIKIPDEVINRVKEIDLLSYLEMYEPDELVHWSGNVYCTKTHNSLKISNGMWMWWSRRIGGKNALDYLMKVKEMTFIDAVKLLASLQNINVCIDNSRTRKFEKKNKQLKSISLPAKAPNNDLAIKYLAKRGISENIIKYCIDNGYIYEGDFKANVVFLGFDEEGEVKYASLRGTSGVRFFKEVRGSDKTYSFRFINKSSDELNIFESAIDLLSYATILEQQGFDWKNRNLLSLSGIYIPKNNEQLPRSLDYFLKTNTQIKKINLFLDNDTAGKGATDALVNALSKNFKVHPHFVSVGKDVNDFLLSIVKEKNNN